eukprot:scaffold29296_cov144-Isochrysis_galbana.AAC.4
MDVSDSGLPDSLSTFKAGRDVGKLNAAHSGTRSASASPLSARLIVAKTGIPPPDENAVAKASMQRREIALPATFSVVSVALASKTTLARFQQ